MNHKLPMVLSFAHSSLSVARRKEIMRFLNSEGLIETSMSYMSYKINYVDKVQDNFCIVIDDYNKIMSYLPMLCSNCGKEIVQRASNHTYCKECWKEKQKVYDRKRKGY